MNAAAYLSLEIERAARALMACYDEPLAILPDGSEDVAGRGVDVTLAENNLRTLLGLPPRILAADTGCVECGEQAHPDFVNRCWTCGLEYVEDVS